MEEKQICYISREECGDKNQIIMNELKEVKTEIKNLSVDLAALPEKLIEKMDERYVSKESFGPVQKIVYGLVGIILISFIGAIIALVMKKLMFF